MVSSQQCAAMYCNNTIKDCILHRFPQNDAKRLLYINIPKIFKTYEVYTFTGVNNGLSI